MEELMRRVRELAPKLPGSTQAAERSARVLGQEVVGTVLMPFPFYVERAVGSRVFDVDGNEYIDLTGGFGPLILGHSPEVAVEAVKQAAEQSMQTGLPTPYQAELAELITEAAPNAEKVAFFNSGTEATMYAIRAARAASGKRKVGQFVGGYHGSHDLVSIEADKHSDPRRPGVLPRGAGVLQETLDQVVMLPYRSDAAFELIREHAHELAVVIVQTIQNSIPSTDVGPFLQELRAVCTECDVLLLIDEVLTGFRFGYGGGQEYFGVHGDLITYGKIIGGGLPIGAVAGPAAIMDLFGFPLHENAIAVGGTFGGNPMVMRAGAAVLRHLRDHPEIYSELSRQSQRMAREINGFLEEQRIAAHLMQAESMFHMIFQKEPVVSVWDIDTAEYPKGAAFYAALANHGVLVPGIHLFFLSAAHTTEDVDTVIQAFKQTFRDLQKQGVF